MKVEYRKVFFTDYHGRVVPIEDSATGDVVVVINAAEFDKFMEAYHRLVVESEVVVRRNDLAYTPFECAIHDVQKLEGGEE